MSEVKEIEGAAFFKAMAHGANFKWMELAVAGASEERLDAQADLAALLKATAKLVEKIEAMDAPPVQQEPGR